MITSLTKRDASLGLHVIGPPANTPSHIILTPGRPVMCRGPSFIVSTMQEETTPIFKRLWYDWTQQQPGIEPTNPLGQCWVPPIVAFYDQQGLLRTYSLPGSSIRSPHPGSPRGSPNLTTTPLGPFLSSLVSLRVLRLWF